MMKVELDLELLSDVCLSSSNRTLGEPHTHDYLPGRALWGALASEAYRRGGKWADEAFRLFQQGAVRVLDAVPVCGSQRAFPAPRAWHYPKAELEPAAYHNFALESVRREGKGKQFKAFEGGWVSADGSRVTVETSHSLRTAVDPTGKARDGLLHGLPVIPAGHRFWAALAGSQEDVERVCELFGREVRLGRSRNTELGLVKLSRRQQPIGTLSPGNGQARQVSFLCLSRCIFRDQRTGAPTLQPAPEEVGLDPSWRFDPSSSFLKFARIVHFNAKRGRPESERLALERGSVLTFAGKEPVDLAEVVARVEGGVGEHRGQGYGELLVAPAWLTEERVEVQPFRQEAATKASPPDDPLFDWASKQASKRRQAGVLYTEACDQAEGFRRYKLPASQWGVLRRMAREARFRDSQARTLFDDLFDDKRGFLTTGKRRLSKGWNNASKQLFEVCQKRQADLPMFLELLASACMRPAGEEPVGRTEEA